MTYYLEPWIERISSPIVLIYPAGEKQEFQDGKETAGAIFSEPYVIASVHAVDGMVEIALHKAESPDTTFF